MLMNTDFRSLEQMGGIRVGISALIGMITRSIAFPQIRTLQVFRRRS